MQSALVGIIAAAMLLSALFVVTAKNLVHSVLWLGLSLASTAILYLVLEAPFLAGTQLLLYVGGLTVLLIFGVMLTRRHDGVEAPSGHKSRARGFVAAATLFGLIAWAVARTEVRPMSDAAPIKTEVLGRVLFTDALLAFEVLSLLLLAAMVGAIVLARRRDPGAGSQGGR